MSDLGLRYGEALFLIAKDNQAIDLYYEQNKLLIELLEDNPDYLALLNSAFINKDEKHALINKCFKPFDINMRNFIKVIIDNKRARYLLDICYDFNSVCNEYYHIKEGLIYTAMKLDKNIIKKIESSLSKNENSKIELKQIIDPSLIGGIKIVINNHIYDASILSKIDSMKSELLRK